LNEFVEAVLVQMGALAVGGRRIARVLRDTWHACTRKLFKAIFQILDFIRFDRNECVSGFFAGFRAKSLQYFYYFFFNKTEFSQRDCDPLTRIWDFSQIMYNGAPRFTELNESFKSADSSWLEFWSRLLVLLE
jgi:hypothetical protein